MGRRLSHASYLTHDLTRSITHAHLSGTLKEITEIAEPWLQLSTGKQEFPHHSQHENDAQN